MVSLTFPLLLISLGLVVGCADGLICPDDTIIFPCTCTDDQIHCLGPLVTEEGIRLAFEIIRDVNSLLPQDQLIIEELHIWQTNLTKLDLSPFLNLTTSFFGVYLNPQLSTIVGPGSIHQPSIEVPDVLDLNANSLTDEGLGDSLKYFLPSLKGLHLYGNSLSGSLEMDLEFFPGISQFTQLEIIDLGENEITWMDNQQFNQNNKLHYFNLIGNTNLTINVNGFAFDETESTVQLHMELSYCDLDDESIFYQENQLLAPLRPITLDLSENNFEFISASNFEMLLNGTESNEVWLHGNPIICDQRMKWLHDQKDLFETKVLGANCQNDPGFNVFTTSLIN